MFADHCMKEKTPSSQWQDGDATPAPMMQSIISMERLGKRRTSSDIPSITVSDWSSEEDIKKSHNGARCISTLSSQTSEEGNQNSKLGSEMYLTASEESNSADESMTSPSSDLVQIYSLQKGLQKSITLSGKKYFVFASQRSKLDSSSDDLSSKLQHEGSDCTFSNGETSASSPMFTTNFSSKVSDSSTFGSQSTNSKEQVTNLPSPKQRTPNILSLSIAMAKKHLSQPQMSSDRMFGKDRNAISMVKPYRPQETDIDLVDEQAENILQKMDMGYSDSLFSYDVQEIHTTNQISSSPEKITSSKPPTPPLHRFPSWVKLLIFLFFSVIYLTS